jgi:hypothetical protein
MYRFLTPVLLVIVMVLVITDNLDHTNPQQIEEVTVVEEERSSCDNSQPLFPSINSDASICLDILTDPTTGIAYHPPGTPPEGFIENPSRAPEQGASWIRIFPNSIGVLAALSNNTETQNLGVRDEDQCYYHGGHTRCSLSGIFISIDKDNNVSILSLGDEDERRLQTTQVFRSYFGSLGADTSTEDFETRVLFSEHGEDVLKLDQSMSQVLETPMWSTTDDYGGSGFKTTYSSSGISQTVTSFNLTTGVEDMVMRWYQRSTTAGQKDVEFSTTTSETFSNALTGQDVACEWTSGVTVLGWGLANACPGYVSNPTCVLISNLHWSCIWDQSVETPFVWVNFHDTIAQQQ